VKRRNFLALAGFSGLGIGLGIHYLSNSNTDTQAATKEQSSLLHFVSVADTGTGTRGQYAVAEAMNRHFVENPFSLILLAGDNIYNNGEISKINAVFEKPYSFLRQKNIPFYAALGNHDIRTNNGEDEISYSAFNMQGRYYTFIRDKVQFFALDTNQEGSDWDKQLKWLENNLASSQAKWKVVFGHHPVYSSGLHGSTPLLMSTLPPLFSRYGVNLYINGHDHNYERTIPMEGTTYLTCGGGASTRVVENSEWTAYARQELSFASFNVYANKIVINAIDTDNDIFDQGEIFAS
jgi:3',5'-cyclic AMP phosphodiesterase CpdA